MKNSDFTNELTTKTLQRLVSEALPARTSFIIALNLKAITDIVKVFEEKRSALVNKYAKKDEKGELIRPVDADGKPDTNQVVLDNAESFMKELQDLLDVDPEVKILKVKPEGFGDVKLSPLEVTSILWMLDE